MSKIKKSRPCRVCKELFYHRNPQVVTCSDECRDMRRKHPEEKPMRERTCRRCEEKFGTNKAIWYCPRCSYERGQEHYKRYNCVPGAGIAWNLDKDPYQCQNFLKNWEGRVPSPHLGF